jgi:branched-chain amino acid aminotransferase
MFAMADEPAPAVWLNGALLPARQARIDPGDRGFTLGDGLFETIRAEGGIPRHLALHLARLRSGAAQLDIGISLDDRALEAALMATLASNRLTDQAVLRLTLSRGTGLRGIAPPPNPTPTLLITAAAFAEPPATVTAIICRSTRRNERSPLAAIKSLNVLDGIMARQEAGRRGAEDAILLNTKDDLAEATGSNIFLLGEGGWLTPRVQDGALPGTLRARILTSGAASEARLTEADLLAARTICLGNALGVRAVAMLDGQDTDIQPQAVATLRAALHRPE